MYYTDFARISDLGIPNDLDPAIYNPGETWYLGTKVYSTGFPLVTTFPEEVARSPHSVFRYLVQKPLRETNPPSFFYATSDLQRANEYAIAQQAFFVRVFNDGNVTMEGADGVLWTSNTNDHASSNPTRSNFLDLTQEPFAAASPNGIYILYVSEHNRLRLVNNGFNSARFALWCRDHPERFDNAVLYQSNLCWNSLKEVSDNPRNIRFKDQRCTCIGGSRLFNVMVPDTGNVPQALLAPVSENLPCIVNGCSESFQDDDKPTNVSKIWTDRCPTGRIFSICQQVFELKTGADLVNVSKTLIQDCSTSLGKCTNNSQCGPGMACLGGKCTTTCTNQQQCQRITGVGITVKCEKGFCIQGTEPVTMSAFSWATLCITIGVLILVALLFALVVFAAKRR